VRRPILAVALAILLPGLTAPRARADLTISGGDVSVSGGQTVTMDLTISYVSNPSSTDNSNTLSAFGLTLMITPLSGGGPDLTFSTSQPNPWDSSLGADYVFAGVSGSQDSNGSSPFWNLPPSSTTNPNDTLTTAFGDFYDTSSPNATMAGDVTIPDNPNGLNSYLATVQFSTRSVASTEEFQVSLTSASTFTAGDGGSLNYNVDVGTVTVEGLGPLSIVPEPASAITGLTGAFFFTAYGWLRRRRSPRRAA
jgi:hypothetical protein